MKHEITALVNRIGIKDVGFCDFRQVSGRLLDCRAKQRLPQNARTVIVCTFPYKVKQQRPENISRYAAVPDYHRVCGKFLEKITAELKIRFPLNDFEWFIDNSPIPEVFAAASAGLGVEGENGLLITPRYGSWVFVGEVVTDLEISCQNSLKKCCLCGNCKKACPRGIHATDCLSAVSQQKKELSDEQKAALKENNIIWGCDLCAESCPMNQNAQTTYIEEFISGYRNCYTLGEDIKNRAYEWRGEKVVLRNYRLFDNPKI